MSDEKKHLPPQKISFEVLNHDLDLLMQIFFENFGKITSTIIILKDPWIPESK